MEKIIQIMSMKDPDSTNFINGQNLPGGIYLLALTSEGDIYFVKNPDQVCWEPKSSRNRWEKFPGIDFERLNKKGGHK